MKEITKSELQSLLSSEFKGFILDTREPEEYEEGHINTAILAPWHSILEKVSGIKKDTPLILYCRTGVRAIKSARLLEQAGFNNITLYTGSYQDWTA